MSCLNLDYSALGTCLQGLQHFSIEAERLTDEPGYGVKCSAYSKLVVATLDSGMPAAKLVAAKKLRLGNDVTPPERIAFRLARELKVWAGLAHKHVLPLIGFHLSDTYQEAMLISEYMLHGDLKGYITKMKPSYEERLLLVRDLTDGLAYLHTQDIPIRHGDVKPSNVLVNLQCRALLADFGLSKAVGTDRTGLTTGNGVNHTRRYACPEILFGTAPQSLHNDIWSWGCLVWEAMIDERPFADTGNEELIILALYKGCTPYDVEDSPFHLPQLKELASKSWSFDQWERPTAVHCLSVLNSVVSTLGSKSVPLQKDHAQPPEPGTSTRLEEFDKFFVKSYDDWLIEQRRTELEPPLVDGYQVQLHKLFLVVGALGGSDVVHGSNWWDIVSEMIGIPDCTERISSSESESVAEQLCKIFQTVLAEFEEVWHNSFSRHDPSAAFPLPPPLQHLRSTIQGLASVGSHMKQHQRQIGAGTQRPPEGGARGTTLNQIPQDVPQLEYALAAVQQPEASILNQARLALRSKSGPSAEGFEVAQPLALGDNTFQPLAPHSRLHGSDVLGTISLLPSKNAGQEELVKIDRKVKAASGLFLTNSEDSHINLQNEEGNQRSSRLPSQTSQTIELPRSPMPAILVGFKVQTQEAKEPPVHVPLPHVFRSTSEGPLAEACNGLQRGAGRPSKRPHADTLINCGGSADLFSPAKRARKESHEEFDVEGNPPSAGEAPELALSAGLTPESAVESDINPTPIAAQASAIPTPEMKAFVTEGSEFWASVDVLSDSDDKDSSRV